MVIPERMLGDRMHYLTPLGIAIYVMYLPESLVDIRHRGYERSPLLDGAMSRFPIERVAPAVMIIAGRPGLLKNFKETDGSSVVLLVSAGSREECKAHGIMGICNGKSLRLPEQCSSRREECLAEYHRGHCHCP